MANIYSYATIDSTMEAARACAERGEAHGTAVLAAVQTHGRGRLGKSWHSPPGKGLYCTILLRPAGLAVEDFPFLTLVAGLAVAAVIERLAPIKLGLKWPNDLYWQGKKLGGILTESAFQRTGPDGNYVLVGIGLNVNTSRADFPNELQDTATSLLLASGNSWPIEQVFSPIREEIVNQIDHFSKAGLADIIDQWRQRDFLLGQRLQWLSVGRQCVEGVSMGIDDWGRLHIRDDAGVIHEVLSGDIQLGRKATGTNW